MQVSSPQSESGLWEGELQGPILRGWEERVGGPFGFSLQDTRLVCACVRNCGQGRQKANRYSKTEPWVGGVVGGAGGDVQLGIGPPW